MRLCVAFAQFASFDKYTHTYTHRLLRVHPEIIEFCVFLIVCIISFSLSPYQFIFSSHFAGFSTNISGIIRSNQTQLRTDDGIYQMVYLLRTNINNWKLFSTSLSIAVCLNIKFMRTKFWRIFKTSQFAWLVHFFLFPRRNSSKYMVYFFYFFVGDKWLALWLVNTNSKHEMCATRTKALYITMAVLFFFLAYTKICYTL